MLGNQDTDRIGKFVTRSIAQETARVSRIELSIIIASLSNKQRDALDRELGVRNARHVYSFYWKGHELTNDYKSVLCDYTFKGVKGREPSTYWSRFSSRFKR